MDDLDLDALFEQEAARYRAEMQAGPSGDASPATGAAVPTAAEAAPKAPADAPADSRATTTPPLPATGTRPPADAADTLARHACANADADGVCRGCTCGDAQELRSRIGQLTRELHESLKELQLDQTLAEMAIEIPDARSRLKYVTEMCERSAVKVLDSLDELAPIQQQQRDEGEALQARWSRLVEGRQPPPEGYMALFEDTRRHLAESSRRSDRTSALHTEILMAQDFQDLTGQVCRKIEAITHRIETQLIHLLVDTAPEETRERNRELIHRGLEGPQVTRERDDVAHTQADVDGLLDSLGF